MSRTLETPHFSILPRASSEFSFAVSVNVRNFLIQPSIVFCHAPQAREDFLHRRRKNAITASSFPVLQEYFAQVQKTCHAVPLPFENNC
jgi:hypothetical protein